MTLPFTAEVRDSLSNLAASLNAGRDKTMGDAFFLFDIDRAQTEAMYRGDWLARKIIDIVPYDMVREGRAWSGTPVDVAAAEGAERRFGLRKLIQRALTLGRLYGGAALIIGTGEEDPEALAQELYPEFIRPGGVKFLHVVSRWQLSTPTVNRDPLSRWFGEPDYYEVTAPTRGALRLHPSRVIRFLGNELPDPSIGVSVWSDSVLQTLYDAIHAVALTTTGATSLMHEAKVDVVTVPNLSEHLSSAATTAQLSARFSYAAAMKSLNNLLLLGDGETWSRQKIDFAGLPEMVRTFLQVAAGAADIPVTRLLGQSPAGMSATGESDTRNYYDMIAARQAIDLRAKLERLDQLILRSAGVDPAALNFEFRPLWQMDAAASASIALQKAQATQIYAGLNLWPASVTARLVQSQLVEDGTYPGAEGIFAEAPLTGAHVTTDFDPAQPRDPDGRWTNGGGSGGFSSTGGTLASESEAQAQTPAAPQPPEAPGSPPSQPAGGIPHDLGEVIGSILGALNPIGTASAHEAPAPGEHETGASPVPTAGLPDAIVRSVLPLIVAALPLVYQALRGVAEEVAKHLPAWTSSGPPPDPKPPRMPAKPKSGSPGDPAAPDEPPRPLTIHPRHRPASGPQGSSPANPEPPDDGSPDLPSHLLLHHPPDLPSSSSPGAPGIPNPPTTLESIEVPPGLTLKARGETIKQRADDYAEDVRNAFGFDRAPPKNKEGDNQPDGLREGPVVGFEIALEVKYLSSSEKKLRDPSRDIPFINQKDLEQASKYLDEFKGGLLWVTNNKELSDKYNKLFEDNRLSGFRVVYIPSTEE